MKALLTRDQCAALVGVTVRQLQHWDQTGLVPAERGPGGRPRYGLGEIAEAALIQALDHRGVAPGVRPARVLLAILPEWTRWLQRITGHSKLKNGSAPAVAALWLVLQSPRSGGSEFVKTELMTDPAAILTRVAAWDGPALVIDLAGMVTDLLARLPEVQA